MESLPANAGNAILGDAACLFSFRSQNHDPCWSVLMNRRTRLIAILCLVLAEFMRNGWSTTIQAAPCFQMSPDFEQEVAPVLIRRCLECHQSSNSSGGLALDSAESVKKGGDSGPVLQAGEAQNSLLLHRVEAGEMPPLKHGESQKLPAAEIDVLSRWINSGADFPLNRRLDLYEHSTDIRGGRDWWSFQPIQRVSPPVVDSLPGDANPIDKFIGRSLAAHGLTAAPPSEITTLVRRLYWDVTGLPASDRELHRLSNSQQNPRAVEDLIDELLNSPQYGERWARHWLDVVRFAETCGYERDQVKPFAWKYRDWVVNAFNSDMPYDQFIRDQLAGDEIADRSEQSVIATGFLCLGTWNDEPNDTEDYKYERLEDLVHTTSSAFLGMTTKCARCHDHKFDPIPQADYYRMAAAFWPGPIQPRGRELIGGPSAEELGFTEVLGWTDVTTKPAPLHKLKNGERHSPLEPISAASLSCVPSEFREFDAAADTVRTTGLRLQLANWIASPRNPLTARVIVNRLWQHHFGEGLVRSSNNFGYTGEKPTHPELLDWLAAELIDNQWSLKHVHRLILRSRTWQQASLHPKQNEYNQKDAANRLLWRAFRRRKDAESLRDAFLASTGELRLTLGGPSFYPTISPDALEGLSRKAAAWTASKEDEQHRRSLYIFTQRSLLPPLMTTFDLCDSTLPCGQRDVTIVAPQALTLLNNEFVHKRADAIAASLGAGPGNDVPDKTSAETVAEVWRLILNRHPSPDELSASVEHIARQTERFDAASMADTELTFRQSDKTASLLASAVMSLDASMGVDANSEGLVSRWRSNTNAHHASQLAVERRPVLVQNAIHGQPAVRFNGSGAFMHLDGVLLKSDEVTVFAVVTDTASGGHRELLSNWSGRDGNSGTSFFLGMTNENAIRLSDVISGVGEVSERQKPFLLTATNGPAGTSVYQQQRSILEQSSPLPSRRLDTPWVIGQQGNIDGEFWKGDLACIIAFDRQLSSEHRSEVQKSLIKRYQLADLSKPGNPPKSPAQRAIASLCLVLFNSNEFAYID